VSHVANVTLDCEGLFGSSTPVARRVVSREYRTQPPESSNVTARTARGIGDLVKEHRKRASIGVSLTWARTSRPMQPAARGESQHEVAIESDLERSDSASDDTNVESNASMSGPVSFEQANSRDLITKSVYPRLLYAFSDVVCFVTSNARLVESFPPLRNPIPSAGWAANKNIEIARDPLGAVRMVEGWSRAHLQPTSTARIDHHHHQQELPEQ